MKTTQKMLALLGLIVAVAGVIVAVVAIFVPRRESPGRLINTKAYVENNSGQVNVYPKQMSSIVIPIIENRDVHLGDNVYPSNWGYDHNPLYVQIYPQDTAGLIYYNKETGKFLSGTEGQTQVAQRFVDFYSPQIMPIDLDAYRRVSAYQRGDTVPKDLRDEIVNKKADNFVELGGGTVLYLNTDNNGNYYEKYAAVAYLTRIDLSIPFLKSDVPLDSSSIQSVAVVVECYHGGLRPGQQQNLMLLLNDKTYQINTSPNEMRRKEVVTTACRVILSCSELAYDGYARLAFSSLVTVAL